MPNKNDQNGSPQNVDYKVVEDFGNEWLAFDQSELPAGERQEQFDSYFRIFPWDQLSSDASGFDAGCGSGRWAALVAPRVGCLHCIEPSNAIDVARRSLAGLDNCCFHRSTVDKMPIPDNSMDFGYSLGVLHHLPDTQQGITDCVRKLKVGAPLLLYLYYAFDNQPVWYRWLWKTSDVARHVISRSPHRVKYAFSQVIAGLVYFPLARAANLLSAVGIAVHSWPLSAYRKKSFYTMRTDALDRFGTRLERRYTQQQIRAMMENAGLQDVRFSSTSPYWCAVGFKK